MGLVGNGWANCFRTHNELTMGLSGKYPLAPSVIRRTRSTCPTWSRTTYQSSLLPQRGVYPCVVPLGEDHPKVH